MQNDFICLNGEFFHGNEKTISVKNRAFAYGDALFETIHALGTKAQFLNLHWQRLTVGMGLLKMEPPANFNQLLLENSIGKLLNKNRFFKGARIRLTVFRNEGGLYTPQNNSISWAMESSPLDFEKYELNTKGLRADIFDEVHKPVNKLSNLKTTNALLFVLAGIFRTDNKLDECFILNQFGRVTETISSNIFIFIGNTIITPPLTEGCISGTMRKSVLQIAKGLGYEVEEKPVIEKNLLDAEEVFITNAIQGIRWIGAYKDRRYFNFVSRKLLTGLNDAAFNE